MTTFTVCTDVHWSVRSVNGPLACNCWTTISRQSATCLLRKRTFGKSVVVSIAISRLDCIDLISVDSVAKINRLYHRNVSPIYIQPASDRYSQRSDSIAGDESYSKTERRTSRSRDSRTSAPWDTPVHQSSQQSRPKSAGLSHLGTTYV